MTRDNTPGHPEVVPAVFRIGERAVFFYLYGTRDTDNEEWALTEEEQRDLEEQIEGHGGALCQSEREADTIITNEVGLDPLSDKYSFEQTQYVEPVDFVRRCIASGRYAHKPVIMKPMPGRYTGRERTNFTKEDDDNLCKFLARSRPYEDAGGRQGIKLYLSLVAKAQYDDLDYKWAARHPAESWLGRYKKHQREFDPIIARLVKENPPPAGDKGVWPYDRRVNFRSAYSRMYRPGAMAEWLDDEPEELPEELEEQEQPPPSPVRRRARHTLTGPIRERSAPPVEQGRGRVQSAPYPVRRASSRRSSRSLEDMGEFAEDEGVELWRDDDFRPGPEDAGPSGTQRTPTPPSPPQRRSRPQRPAAAPIAGGQRRRAVRPEVPASSQATLVGPVPTQLRGAANAAKLPPPEIAEEAEAPEPKRVAKRRKINHPPVYPVVVLEPLRRTGLGPRSAPQKTANASAGPSKMSKPASEARPVAQEDEDENGSEPDDEDGNGSEQESKGDRNSEDDAEEGSDLEWLDDDVLPPNPANAPQSHTTGPTMEDELEVEELVQTSAHVSGHVSPSANPEVSQSEELDSDDQRSRAKLLPTRPSTRPSKGENRRMSQHELRRKELLSRLATADEDESLAELLDLTRPADPQRAKSAASTSVGTEASARQPRAGPSGVQNPVIPVPAPRRKLGREETVDSTTSSAPGVPLPGTRASEEKQRIRESQRYEPYVPPPGTKAASAQKLQLRSRTVVRGN
ncbi:hypothetical protein ONZ51_g5196 [Trametes cubensis]|uniref:BRCT domain-containing protein n=1 Tax=Trametes cubensis TaxID=1111947 RepID=A0AAD7TUK6_9APHY|nr:hypothetical protein ONZ51_g5196 [Trametes cubensis]